MDRLSLEEALADATQDLEFLGNNTRSLTSKTTPKLFPAANRSLHDNESGSRTQSPLKLASPAPIKAWSKDSILTPIRSPSDRDIDQPGQNQQSPPLDSGDQDEHLPYGSLAATQHSVRQLRTGTPILITSEEDHNLDEANRESGSSRSLTPSKKKFVDVHDVYLNEFGERIEDGKAVGKIIGGRKRIVTPHGGEVRSDAPSSASDKHSGTEKLLLSPSNHLIEKHGQNAARSSTPPAFFLQSFPDALSSPSNSRSQSPLISHSVSLMKSFKLNSAEDGDESQEFLTPSNSNFRELQDQCNPSTLSPTSRRAASPSSPSSHKSELASSNPAPLDPGRSVVSAATVTSTQSAPLILHGNHRQASKAGAGSSQVASTSRASATPSKKDRGIGSDSSGSRRRSKYADEGVTHAPFPFDDDDPAHEDSRSARRLDSNANVIERTASLFFTPLVKGKQVGQPRIEPDRDRLEAEQHQNPTAFASPSRSREGKYEVSASEPSSPVFRPKAVPTQGGATEVDNHDDVDDDDDAASLDSLLSLPVSIHTNSSYNSRSGLSMGSRDSDSPSSALERQNNQDKHEIGGEGSPTMPHNSASVARRRSYRNEASQSQSNRKGQDPDDTFAREVGVQGWNEVGERARGFVVFTVRVTTKTGNLITILRRFSSFVDLRKSLLVECPESSRNLPALPRKKLLHKYDAIYLEGRRRGLQKWLESVLLDPRWGGSRAMREWVGGREE